MSDVIVVLAIAVLRALLVHEILVQEASQRRLEEELRLAWTRLLIPETVTAVPEPDSTASMLDCSPHDSRSTTVSAVPARELGEFDELH